MNTSQVGQERIGTTPRELDELMTGERGGQPPEWIELIPAGEFSGRDGRGPYRLDDAEQVIAGTRAVAMDAGQPIDYDHATDLAAPMGRPAPAAGWIKEVANRNGALWGRVEWTRHGAEALATREYRYVSPVFEHDEKGQVVRLIRAALTNNPNLYVKAIAAKQEGQKVNEGASTAAAKREGSVVRAILGLAQEADGDDVYAELHRVLMAGREKLTLRTQRGEAGEAQEADGKADAHLAIMQARAERVVGEAIRGGQIAPAQREWAMDYCCMDFGGFQKFLERQPAFTLGESEFGRRPLRLVSGRKSEAPGAAGEELSANEIAICARLGIRTADYAKRKNVANESDGRL